MNRAAEEEWEQWEAGYSAPAGYAVCASCVGDAALAELVEEEASEDECSFCGRVGGKVAVDVEVVLRRIGAQLQNDWTWAESVLYHDREEESGYAGPVYEARDVFEIEGVEFGNERFEEFVVVAFSKREPLTPRGVYAMTEGDALNFGWGNLVETVKHRQRFFFALAENDRRWDGVGAPVPRGLELLGELYRLVRDYDLLRELSTEELLYRARVHSVRKGYESAKDLGAPPADSAAQSRMSPAGIPMLYAAKDAETAIAETVGTRRTRKKGLTIGVFRPTEPMRIVDFTRLPELPSFFDDSVETPRIRQELGFLYGMRRDIGREVVLDGHEHTDYVPTQVVCEYLRHGLPDRHQRAVHGLAWESTRAPGSRNVVLFLDRTRCVELGERPPLVKGPLVELVRHERRHVP